MRHFALFFALLLALPLLIVAGCSSSGQARASTASTAVTTATGTAQDIARHVDAVVTALAPFQSGQGDLKKAYTSLAQADTGLAKAIKAVNTDTRRVRQAGDRYAADWDKRIATITDADIAASSRERQDQLRAGLERLAIADTDFQTTTAGFMTQLKDVRTALDLDLSAGGVAALRNAVAATVAAAPAVKQKASALSDRLQGLNGFLSGN